MDKDLEIALKAHLDSYCKGRLETIELIITVLNDLKSKFNMDEMLNKYKKSIEEKNNGTTRN